MAAAAASLPDLRGMIPELAAWLEDAARIHQRSIDARLAREAALLGRPVTHVLVQPGLFDRRAVRAAESLSESDRSIQAEHHWRIAAFGRARHLHFSARPIGVLIVWR